MADGIGRAGHGASGVGLDGDIIGLPDQCQLGRVAAQELEHPIQTMNARESGPTVGVISGRINGDRHNSGALPFRRAQLRIRIGELAGGEWTDIRAAGVPERQGYDPTS